jgi:hypothetical protein
MNQIGLFFAILPLVYTPCCLLVEMIPDTIEKRVTMITAAMLSGVSFLFVGPSQMFGFEDSLLLMAIG